MEKKMRLINIAVFLLLATVSAEIAEAQTVTLKDGSKVEGTLTGEEGDKFIFETASGVRKFDKDFVVNIAFDRQPTEVTYDIATTGTPTPKIIWNGLRLNFDFYLKGDAYKDMKNNFDFYRIVFAESGEFNVVDNAHGFTLGYIRRGADNSAIENGPQFQYIWAPDAKMQLTNFTSQATNTIKTEMMRFTWHVGLPTPLTRSLTFLTKLDAGWLYGKMHETADSAHQNWNGGTFSVSPCMQLGSQKSAGRFEIGASYTYIPQKSSNPDFETFNWTAFGYHIGGLWLF